MFACWPELVTSVFKNAYTKSFQKAYTHEGFLRGRGHSPFPPPPRPDYAPDSDRSRSLFALFHDFFRTSRHLSRLVQRDPVKRTQRATFQLQVQKQKREEVHVFLHNISYSSSPSSFVVTEYTCRCNCWEQQVRRTL